MEAVVRVADVEEHVTRSGVTRYVMRDDEGLEYTTFREGIGEAAKAARGKRARIEFHEQQRDRFTNVYLDKITVEPEAPAEGDGPAGPVREADEAAWRTAVEAAPWLVGASEPREEVPPEELYDKLEPFKELVAEDIKGTDEGEGEDDADRGAEERDDGAGSADE